MWIFQPILKPMIWGGNRLPLYRKLQTDESNIGESWEISGLPGMETKVSCGTDKGLTLRDLINKYGENLIGKHNFIKFGENFPIIVKFIDAGQDLSVQVHPSEYITHEGLKEKGKDEFWYVVSADENSRVANGFIRDLNPDTFRELVKTEQITSALSYCKVCRGDTFYIPSGRVHAIGKGTFIAEIQQASDLTFRIYDYGRHDNEGKSRPLHIKEATDTLCFSQQNDRKDRLKQTDKNRLNLVNTKAFTINLINGEKSLAMDYAELDSFVILTFVEGEAYLENREQRINAKAGDSVLIPADDSTITIIAEGNFKILETFVI